VGKHDANLLGRINQLCRFQNPTGPEELSPVAGRGQAAKVLEAKAREKAEQKRPEAGRSGPNAKEIRHSTHQDTPILALRLARLESFGTASGVLLFCLFALACPADLALERECLLTWPC
jgi:hypothetical protein